MSIRTKNVEEMKKQTLGVEIEMANVTQRGVCEWLAERWGTEYSVRRTIINHDGISIHGYECTDNQGRVWKCVHDSSLRANGTIGTGELVTPILHYEDIEELQEIVRLLRRKGAVSNQRHGCGVHIHVGKDGHTFKSLKNLSNIMASHEDLLIKSVNVSPERYEYFHAYCRKSDADYIRELNNTRLSSIEQLKKIWYESQGFSVPPCAEGYHYHDSRYHMLNLHCAFFGNTVEFRLFEFHKNMHAGLLKSWIQLCLAMSSYSKLVACASYKPVEMENEKFTMRNWLTNMGLIGEEFDTCRKLMLRRLSGDASYRYGRVVIDRPDDLSLTID